MPPLLNLAGIDKSFTVHMRGGIRIQVLSGVEFAVSAGECVVLDGPTGAGKSSILKMIYGNYAVDRGQIVYSDDDADIDIARAEPRRLLALRRDRIGYVSQYLRAVPRVAARDVIAEPLVLTGVAPDEAIATSEVLLRRLNMPARLWDLPPATFSGGEQQRVNVARGFIGSHRLLLLDEPTASLDEENSRVVLELIAEKKAMGVAVVGVFHDAAERSAVADRIIDVTRFAASAKAA
jgi:alpha-D-ribose 1-methylphosphonate 5-triphosphate synthase subunit PhnL